MGGVTFSEPVLRLEPVPWIGEGVWILGLGCPHGSTSRVLVPRAGEPVKTDRDLRAAITDHITRYRCRCLAHMLGPAGGGDSSGSG